nr:chorismate mutase [cf. Phormidesmis sp. LEGE 11477]
MGTIGRRQGNRKEGIAVDWQIHAIRGATTVPENSTEAMAIAVNELLDALESRNPLDTSKIVSVTFSVTRDLDAVFPAAIARKRPTWDSVPLLDVQQMHVEGSLPKCIRFMLHIYLPIHHTDVSHIYLRGAQKLRPDLCLAAD